MCLSSMIQPRNFNFDEENLIILYHAKQYYSILEDLLFIASVTKSTA